MKTMWIIRVSLAVTVLTIGLFGAAASRADRPEIFREAVAFDGPVAECDGFEVWNSGWERDTYKYWHDESGVAVRLQLIVILTESQYYNRNDPTKVITQGKNGVGEGGLNFIDLTTGDVSFAGLGFRVTIPGIGRVMLFAGSGFWDASEQTLTVRHGPEFFLEGETGLALCEALK